MIRKIILLLAMAVGAIFVYGAQALVSKLKFLENNEKNILAMKITGFVIILVAAIIAFSRF